MSDDNLNRNTIRNNKIKDISKVIIPIIAIVGMYICNQLEQFVTDEYGILPITFSLAFSYIVYTVLIWIVLLREKHYINPLTTNNIEKIENNTHCCSELQTKFESMLAKSVNNIDVEIVSIKRIVNEELQRIEKAIVNENYDKKSHFLAVELEDFEGQGGFSEIHIMDSSLIDDIKDTAKGKSFYDEIRTNIQKHGTIYHFYIPDKNDVEVEYNELKNKLCRDDSEIDIINHVRVYLLNSKEIYFLKRDNIVLYKYKDINKKDEGYRSVKYDNDGTPTLYKKLSGTDVRNLKVSFDYYRNLPVVPPKLLYCAISDEEYGLIEREEVYYNDKSFYLSENLEDFNKFQKPGFKIIEVKAKEMVTKGINFKKEFNGNYKCDTLKKSFINV